MMNQRCLVTRSVIGCALLFLAGCSSSTENGPAGVAGHGGTNATGTGGSGVPNGSGSGGQPGGVSTGGQTSAPTGGVTSSGGTGGETSSGTGGGGGTTTGGGTAGAAGGETGGATSGGSAGSMAGAGGSAGEMATGGSAGAGTGGASGGTGGQAGSPAGGTGGEGGSASSCTGKAWPTADPTAPGPFEVAADKNVGPLAGVVPDPIYGDQQQRFNVYRPKNLANSGYCHPILIWANGYTDNPEPNPPQCVVDQAANKWCGQYLPLMNHLASHGFVVVASLSTATGAGDPLPTIVGLDWIVEQAKDPSSPYFGRLDTSNIGQLGHSFGGMSTCMSASEPRYKALATVCGTRELSGVHTPMLFYCGGRDSTVSCSSVRNTFLTVKDQPAFFLNERDADHGSWVYQGTKGVSLSSLAAWFRVHLMGDTANRKYFYGANCTFCTDNRVQAEQNSLMAQ